MFFLGDNGHAARLVSLPYRSCRLQGCYAASENKIFVGCVVQLDLTRFLCLDEVLLADAADRTYIDRGVEYSAADKTFDQSSRTLCLRFRFLLEKHTSEVIAEVISVCQLIFTRFETYAEAIQNFQSDLFQPLNDVRNALAGPAITSERAGKSALEYRRIHAQSQIVNRFQSLAENRRRTEKITVCRRHVRGKIGLIIENKIIAVNFRSCIFYTFCDLLRELLRISICADIGHNDKFFSLLCRGLAPLIVPTEDLVEMGIKDRTVSAADRLYVEILDAFQSRVHVWICKWSDDTVKVILRRFRIALLIRNGRAKNSLRRIV